MKLAFYKAKQPHNKYKLDGLVDALTGGYGYSHVELVFPDGTCFSSSVLDGGTRFKKINLNPERWVVVDLPNSLFTPKYSADRVHMRASKILNRGYDHLGILFYHLIPFKIQDNGKWWCDEAVCWALGMRKFRNNPNKLAKMVGLGPAKFY